jgi:hypothetical protein
MISVFYTGDRRHNEKIMEQNHFRFLKQIATIDHVDVKFYTKDFAERGVCPFDEGGDDTRLRRGQGGAVQVWDFVTSVDRSPGEIVIKLRTDVWFTDSSIRVITQHLQDIVNNRSDIVFFGSDLVNDNQGKEHEVIPIANGDPPRIQDFVVIARKSSLEPSYKVIEDLLNISPKKRRSGNKTFRDIVSSTAKASTVLCHLWLIRRWYDTMPTDHVVCGDYIQSYIEDGKNVDDILQPALDWWSTYK